MKVRVCERGGLSIMYSFQSAPLDGLSRWAHNLVCLSPSQVLSKHRLRRFRQSIVSDETGRMIVKTGEDMVNILKLNTVIY